MFYLWQSAEIGKSHSTIVGPCKQPSPCQYAESVPSTKEFESPMGLGTKPWANVSCTANFSLERLSYDNQPQGLQQPCLNSIGWHPENR